MPSDEAECEMGLELDCLNTQIFLGVAQCKILQYLGSYGTIPQLDQQLVNLNLVSVKISQSFCTTS